MTKQEHLAVVNMLHESRAFKFNRIIIKDALFAEPEPGEDNYPAVEVYGSNCGHKHNCIYSTELIAQFLPTGFCTVIEVDENGLPYIRIFI